MIAEKIKANWFILALVIVIATAKTFPWIGAKGGPLKPEITVKYFAVFFIFFNSGMTLKSEELKSAVKQVRLHAFIQLFTLAFIPCFVFLLLKFLAEFTDFSDWMLKGIQIVACMPPPVSSAVILTKAIGGNEAAAIFNSAFGSFLGIFITPLLLFQFIGVSATLPILNVFITLFSTVVVPIILGQVTRRYIRDWLERTKPPFGVFGSCALLLIIYTTFCDTFSRNDMAMDKSALMTVVIIIVVFQFALIGLVVIVTSRLLKFPRPDTVAAMFCATHKSLTLGIPMLKVIYHGDAFLSTLCTPLLIYHPIQILIGGLLVQKTKTWMKQGVKTPVGKSLEKVPDHA